jgi:hypothetical protein
MVPDAGRQLKFVPGWFPNKIIANHGLGISKACVVRDGLLQSQRETSPADRRRKRLRAVVVNKFQDI